MNEQNSDIKCKSRKCEAIRLIGNNDKNILEVEGWPWVANGLVLICPVDRLFLPFPTLLTAVILKSYQVFGFKLRTVYSSFLIFEAMAFHTRPVLSETDTTYDFTGAPGGLREAFHLSTTDVSVTFR